MYRSLYFKIILILVIFIITVMSVVGTILLNSVSNFYTNDFLTQMNQTFSASGTLRQDLLRVLDFTDYVEAEKTVLNAYSGPLGIDNYRDYYILNETGEVLEGSTQLEEEFLPKTANMLAAMSGKNSNTIRTDSEYTDYAVALKGEKNACIIYIKDTQEEMRQVNWILFSIIIQSLLLGLIIAIILSFFLAKAITAPIQSLTKGAQLIAAGEFTHEIDVHSKDEIGTLTDTFNHMKTVLKSTLEEVSGERQKLETVFSYLKDSVIAFTESGKVLNINRSAMELLGENYTETFTFSTLLDLLHIRYVESYLGDPNTYLDGKTDRSYVLRDIEFVKKALDINFGIIKYVENNQRHDGIITVIHDITNRYELDKERREFVANVSHELRTPLTGIRGYMETIVLNPSMEEETRQLFLENAIDECDRMTRIVADLLVLSRLDNNKTQWQITQFDCKKMLERICEVLRVTAAKQQQTLSLQIAAPLPWMTADKERIEQVVVNIISNALKYTPEKGKIDVCASVEGMESIVIQVRDNGIGIPEEDIPRLFERFYRVEKARTSDTGGTGLGLAIAKEILVAHGGTISIQSELQKGTEVTIILPIDTKLENGSESHTQRVG